MSSSSQNHPPGRQANNIELSALQVVKDLQELAESTETLESLNLGVMHLVDTGEMGILKEDVPLLDLSLAPSRETSYGPSDHEDIYSYSSRENC
ncbi:hypothetical protein P691DRAFT_764870 [Macrolepiota fuliginosa MF-IS2]|uniref:Uncharacterized protein n=1 Tax=Macrolepiota fuliginosa MF-IS2 TaxID=1400762 RepID=A0A9P6BYL7_9AGAR|nr:hypothetical protein P691DRAFT_764870 [Macrolepiota fuliginosa MF-IS2]